MAPIARRLLTAPSVLSTDGQWRLGRFQGTRGGSVGATTLRAGQSGFHSADIERRGFGPSAARGGGAR